MILTLDLTDEEMRELRSALNQRYFSIRAAVNEDRARTACTLLGKFLEAAERPGAKIRREGEAAREVLIDRLVEESEQ